jgi:hypothetical protein
MTGPSCRKAVKGWFQLGLAALLLQACAGTAWEKEGASSDRMRADLGECRSAAYAATRTDQNIDADILASRSHDWDRTGTLTMRRETMAAQTRGRADDIVDRCMRAKGYARAP